MDGFRQIAPPLIRWCVFLAVLPACWLGLIGQERPALALVVGMAIGIGYLYDIARGFDRLAERQKAYLPFCILAGMLRVLLVGAVPVLIVGQGPIGGYAAYLAGFVTPLTVSAFVIRNLIRVDGGASAR